MQSDYGALSSAVCLCVCASGLFGEDIAQRGYRLDRRILVYVARNPGSVNHAIAVQVGRAERVVAARLKRLCEADLLVEEQTGVGHLSAYRLGPVAAEEGVSQGRSSAT
ncbi:winged helix-turn-helix transcriptional regulator [Streptomyces nigrescens]